MVRDGNRFQEQTIYFKTRTKFVLNDGTSIRNTNERRKNNFDHSEKKRSFFQNEQFKIIYDSFFTERTI